MGFRKSPAEMFGRCAARFKGSGDRRWGMARSRELPSNHVAMCLCGACTRGATRFSGVVFEQTGIQEFFRHP